MSRISSGDVVTVKPSNNVYTALTGAALVVVAVGMILFWMKASELLGGSLM